MSNTCFSTKDREYDRAFSAMLRGQTPSEGISDISIGKTAYGTYELPDFEAGKFTDALNEQSLFRHVATTVYNYGDSTIMAKDCEDKASWVPEGQAIPVYDGMDDFTKYTIGSHKLATIVRFDENFVFSPGFNLEKNLVSHMAKAMGRAEDEAFILGDGVNQPTGILAAEKGAEVGVSASAMTYDSVIGLYFSVKPEYRKNGKWLMSDETAQALRTMKDADGNYLWNQSNDTILGKEVMISEFMPAVAAGKKPIAFGDFSYYWVIDRDHFSVRALREKFAMNQQVGYLGFEFLDGLLVRSEAVKVLDIAE